MKGIIDQLRFILADKMLGWSLSLYPEGVEKFSLAVAIKLHFTTIKKDAN